MQKGKGRKKKKNKGKRNICVIQAGGKKKEKES